MNWQRVENRRHEWTARVGDVNYYLRKWPLGGWAWNAYAVGFVASCVTDRPYQAAKRDAEAFARRVGNA